MKPARICALAALSRCCWAAASRSTSIRPGCTARYAGKADNLPYQVQFHNDKLAWSRPRIQDRTLKQNEYIRANP